MSVTSVNEGTIHNTYTETAHKAAENSQAAVKNPEKQAIDEKAFDADSFQKSEKLADKKTGYEKLKKLSKAQIDSLKSMQADNMRNLVAQLIGKQASASKTTSTESFFSATQIKVEIESTSVEAAAGAKTAENAELQDVDSVATRIMDMAVSLAGGDNTKLGMLRDAVKKGFEEAGAAFGRELPQVCHDTLDEVMKRFDYWEKNGSLENYVYNAAKDDAEKAEA